MTDSHDQTQATAGGPPASTPEAPAAPVAAAAPSAAPASGPSSATTETVREAVIEVLRSVYDPEIPVNIYDLGLVYGIEVSDAREVVINLTLTSPMCPVAGTLPPEVEQKVGELAAVARSTVNLVWEPPWTKDLMSDDAKATLNIW